jgi:hypothetical protein
LGTNVKINMPLFPILCWIQAMVWRFAMFHVEHFRYNQKAARSCERSPRGAGNFCRVNHASDHPVILK